MIRVHLGFEGKAEVPGGADGHLDLEANKVDIGADGSLVLSHFTVKKAQIIGQPDQVSSMLVRVIRRDLWTMVEVAPETEPDVIEIGAPGELAPRLN